jgi:hypothetical protein
VTTEHKPQNVCKHDGYLASTHSRLKSELKCMKCGKVWKSR